MQVVDPLNTVDATNSLSDALEFEMFRSGLKQNVSGVPHETICTSHYQNPNQDRRYGIQPRVAGEHHDQAADYHSNRRDGISDRVKKDSSHVEAGLPGTG